MTDERDIWFGCPEACDEDGNARASADMRPLANGVIEDVFERVAPSDEWPPVAALR